MFNSVILNIAITLVFIFLVLAIMVTGINEIWFTFLRTKANKLEKFLDKLFFDAEWNGIVKDLKKSPFINVLKKETDAFPAKIPAENFTSALLTIIGDGKIDMKSIRDNVKKKTDPGQFYKMLTAILSQNKTIEGLRKEIDTMFNNSMDRLSGWYKRNAKIMSLFVALGICAALNIDTINIATSLWKDKEQAEKFASFAVEASKNFEKNTSGEVILKDQEETLAKFEVTAIPAEQDTSAVNDKKIDEGIQHVVKTYNVLTDMGIPMGWTKKNIPPCSGNFFMDAALWLLKVLGIALTAIATSLGAPFWFDVLNRVTPLKKAPVESAASAEKK